MGRAASPSQVLSQLHLPLLHLDSFLATGVAGKFPSIRAGSWHRVVVAVTATQLEVLVDGKFVLSADNAVPVAPAALAPAVSAGGGKKQVWICMSCITYNDLEATACKGCKEDRPNDPGKRCVTIVSSIVCAQCLRTPLRSSPWTRRKERRLPPLRPLLLRLPRLLLRPLLLRRLQHPPRPRLCSGECRMVSSLDRLSLTLCGWCPVCSTLSNSSTASDGDDFGAAFADAFGAIDLLGDESASFGKEEVKKPAQQAQQAQQPDRRCDVCEEAPAIWHCRDCRPEHFMCGVNDCDANYHTGSKHSHKRSRIEIKQEAKQAETKHTNVSSRLLLVIAVLTRGVLMCHVCRCGSWARRDSRSARCSICWRLPAR